MIVKFAELVITTAFAFALAVLFYITITKGDE